MLGVVIIWLANLGRRWSNLWRALLRRRVDYVQIELRGTLPEFAARPSWWQRRLLGARAPLSLQELRRRFQRIGADPHVRGVLLMLDQLALPWARIQSLRDAILELRSQGKRVLIFGSEFDTASYYLACAADTIIVPPPGLIAPTGLRLELSYLREALAQLDIQVEVTAVSPYKAAYERFVRDQISAENREQLERLLQNQFDDLLASLAQRRGIERSVAQALIDDAPYTAPRALELGLIDQLCYEDELATWLRDGGEQVKLLNWEAARRVLRVLLRQRQRRYVAVVSIEGGITSGDSRSMPLPIPGLNSMAGSESIAQALRRVERNPRIAALVLHVDSPGGSALASDLIAREVARVQRKMPVVVSMGAVAASGGYYVATPANAIFAQPATITGSIGVIALRPDLSGLNERLGVNVEVLSRGAHSGLFSFTQTPSQSERQALQRLVFDLYEQFKQHVRAGRQISDEQLEPLAGGRIWHGRDALRFGLIDKLGGLPAAVAHARELAALPADPQAPLLLISSRGERLPPEPFPLATLLQLLINTRLWMLSDPLLQTSAEQLVYDAAVGITRLLPIARRPLFPSKRQTRQIQVEAI